MDVGKIIAGVLVVGLTISGGMIFLSTQPSVYASVATMPRASSTNPPSPQKQTPASVFASQCTENLKKAIRETPRYYKGNRATSKPAEVCDCVIDSLAASGITDGEEMKLLTWMDSSQIGPVSQQHVGMQGKSNAEIMAIKNAQATELSARMKKMGARQFISFSQASEKARRDCKSLLKGL